MCFKFLTNFLGKIILNISSYIIPYYIILYIILCIISLCHVVSFIVLCITSYNIVKKCNTNKKVLAIFLINILSMVSFLDRKSKERMQILIIFLIQRIVHILPSACTSLVHAYCIIFGFHSHSLVHGHFMHLH